MPNGQVHQFTQLPSLPGNSFASSVSFTGSVLPVLVTLIGLGNELYRRGQHGDANILFDAAHSALRNPMSLAAASKQIQFGRDRIDGSNNIHITVVEPADTYQEDECDVGPRPFRQPMRPFPIANATDPMNNHNIHALLEATILYNKALISHSRFDFEDAMRLYKSVIQIFSFGVASDLVSLHPTLVDLGMYVNNNMGHIAYIDGSEQAALSYFETSLIFAKNILPSCALVNQDSKEARLAIATVLSNWCRVHWMSGDVNEHVYSALCEVLSIRSSILVRTHVDVATAHYNLGVAEYARRQNEQAVSHLMRYLQATALRACQRRDSDLDPIPALVFILLIKNEDKENDAMAQELVRGLRTLQDKRNDLGPQHPEIASVLNFIGTLLFHQRDFDHALLFFQEELRLEEAFVKSKEDVSVSVTCNNIGRILQELQRLPEAIRYYQRSLQSEYGDDILKMSAKSKQQPMKTAQALARNENLRLPASTMNLYSTVWYNLGLIYDKQGSYSEAIQAFQMSLGLRRVMLGSDHPDAACLLYNIGVLQMEQQLLKDATDSFRAALRIRRVAATGQLNDCHVVKTLQKLASLHKAKGNIEGALEASREILHIQLQSQDCDGVTRNKEVGATLREMSELYHAQGDVDIAVIKAKESVAMLRQLQRVPPESADYIACTEELFGSLLLLGSLYHESCEPVMAFALFEEASGMLRNASRQLSHCTALDALYEVSRMLATCHCAAEA